MSLEFGQEEVIGLKDLGSSLFIPEEEIRKAYDGVIRRAAASEEKPDSLFVLRFIRRPSFLKKSSHREKLLTLLGALQSSISWSGRPNEKTAKQGVSSSRFDHCRRPR